MIKKLFQKINYKFNKILSFVVVWFSFVKLGGRPAIKLGKADFYVCAMMKNDADFVKAFVDHYRNLGAKGIFLIDNGSTDSSISLALAQPDVTVYSTDASFSKHQSLIRRLFLRRYLWGNWVVFVDIDEHLRFPYDDRHSLSDILKYCSLKKFNAIPACMFDVYALDEHGGIAFGDEFSRYKYCSVDLIGKSPYPFDSFLALGNKISRGKLHLYEGGIRKKINPSGHFWLIKHPIMFLSGEIQPFTHPHFCSGASLADFQCGLIHYKFFGDFSARLRRSLEGGQRSIDWVVENSLNSEDILSAACGFGLNPVDISNFSIFYDIGFFSESPELKRHLLLE